MTKVDQLQQQINDSKRSQDTAAAQRNILMKDVEATHQDERQLGQNLAKMEHENKFAMCVSQMSDLDIQMMVLSSTLQC